MNLLHSFGRGLQVARPSWAREVVRALLFPSVLLVMAEPSAGDSGTFQQTGSLHTGRYFHTATLLPNGKVLVAGGRTGFPSGTIIASAELYDPVTGIWTTTGSLGTARWLDTATLLPNGKVLVVGGQGNSSTLATTELYDPATGIWTATGNLGSARFEHTATLLPNGKVLVAGGLGNSNTLASAELYDPATESWTATGSLATARNLFTATLLLSGKALAAGGIGDTGYLASAELYDPAAEIWSGTGNLGVARRSYTATLLPGGKVLAAGGINTTSYLASAEIYDPARGIWTVTGDLGVARYEHTATLLPNGQVLVVGGYGVSGSAELYDPAVSTWTPTGGPFLSGAGHTETLLPNGTVLIAGGFDGNCCPALSGAELYLCQATPPALLNISTRMRVLTGDNVLIGGFIITGTDLKRVLIRGIGPSLNGVGTTLPDPTLELHQGSTTVAINDNWKTRPDGTSQEADIEATTIPPTNDLESAILVMLGPGAYTTILAGNNGGAGAGLVEVYDLGQGANSQLANISTRGFVETGDNVMIGGFIAGGGSGSGTARVMVRALGPSLPVIGALADPTVELRDGNGMLVASDDNWKTRPDGSSQQAEIEATGLAPTNDLESALVQSLASGNYTAIVRGKNNTTGVGLVEFYNLP